VLIKYTRMEEEGHFKDALKQDVFLALRILPKVDVLLRDMLASLEKDEISPSVAAKLNELTLAEVEKILNVLMMLGSNLSHFEGEKKKELLTEQQPEPEVEQTKQRIDTLMQTIQSMSGQNKLED
jgi:predicted secreted acid phosphatase